MVDEIMFLDLPREEREQVMRDNCDQIIERSYTKKNRPGGDQRSEG